MRLVIEDILKRYGGKSVLQGAGFTFEQGKIYGLLGRNGAGKTTLFNCLSGEMGMDGGQVLLETNGGTRKLTDQDVGYVYSLPILPEFLMGYEFVKFFMEINRDKNTGSIAISIR